MLQSAKKKMFLGLIKSQIRKASILPEQEENAIMLLDIIGKTEKPNDLIKVISKVICNKPNIDQRIKDRVKAMAVDEMSREDVTENLIEVICLFNPGMPKDAVKDYAPMILDFIGDEQEQFSPKQLEQKESEPNWF